MEMSWGEKGTAGAIANRRIDAPGGRGTGTLATEGGVWDRPEKMFFFQ